MNFLLSSGIISDENGVILKVDLFTIVPSLRRMVVRTGEESEKTLVLGLSAEAFAKDGEKFLAFTDLKRGDPLILVVGEDHVTVREIYKYHPVPGGGMRLHNPLPSHPQLPLHRRGRSGRIAETPLLDSAAVLLPPSPDVGFVQILWHFGELLVAGMISWSFRFLGRVVNDALQGSVPSAEVDVGGL